MSTAQAATFTEIGDAGQTQAAAQRTTGIGALTDIFGSLLSSTDADLYVVNITNPAAFSASTVNAVGGTLDTQLFLLTMAGAPIAVNDDDQGGLSLLSTLPAGTFSSLAAGMYILGVSMSGYDPVNINSQLLFASNASTTTVRGPASGLQPAVLGNFFDSTYMADSGSYDIKLTGAIAAVPEPASSLLLVMGGAFCAAAAARRRRQAA